MKPREYNPRATLITVLVVSALIAWSYLRQPVSKHVMFTGQTMGTTYEVKIPRANLNARGIRKLQAAFDRRLLEINQQMSTYLPESEISVFNNSTSTAPQKVSLEFAELVREALRIHQATDGAFDPTVLPLVHAWGFGNTTNALALPDAEVLAVARERVGADKLRTPRPDEIQKIVGGLQLDLGAIAKGRAVDELAEILEATAYTNYYVNIGGEIRCEGHSTNDVPWSIAVEAPVASGNQQLYEVVELDQHAMATSGDYRNFFIGTDSNYYAHIIDPATARPVTHQLASVSVVASNCLEADALATALFVMGPQKGLAWVNATPGVEAFFIIREDRENFRHAATPGFKKLIRANPAP